MVVAPIIRMIIPGNEIGRFSCPLILISHIPVEFFDEWVCVASHDECGGLGMVCGDRVHGSVVAVGGADGDGGW